MLDRRTFINLCTFAIEETRKKLAIRNQLSGYLKFHKELKENNYYLRAQSFIRKESSLKNRYHMINHIEMGNCTEVACFLSVTILQMLKALNVEASVKTVTSNVKDHAFVQVIISLKGETPSHWEVDAWDPHMTDITIRPEGRIKNQSFLEYGTKPKILFSTSTKDFKLETNPKLHFLKWMPKPVPGNPAAYATPPREVLKKHKKIYPDLSIEEAYKREKLDRLNTKEIGYLRAVSRWQKKEYWEKKRKAHHSMEKEKGSPRSRK